MEEEWQSHIDARADALIASGVPAPDAARRARLEFGDPLRWKEQGREARGLGWIDEFGSDVHYALRHMRRSPGFTLAAVLTLALGIGANSAIFSVVKALLFTPLPYQDSDRLVHLVENVPAAETPNHQPARFAGIDMAEIRELRRRSHTLSHVNMYAPLSMTLSGRDRAVRMIGARVTLSTFGMLGIDPIIGRVPSESDDDAADAIVLSDALWHRYFNGNQSVIGERVTLGWPAPGGPDDQRDKAYTVVAVMPPSFRFPDAHTLFWIPIAPPRGVSAFGLSMARLADGASLGAAGDEAATILTALGRRPASSARTQPGRFEFVRARDELAKPVSRALVALTVAVWFVLLIACVNVTNLVLARATSRQQEIAIRVALGAGRGRLVRHFLTEGLVLAAFGGLAGVAFSFGGVQLLKLLGTTLARWDVGDGLNFPRIDEIHLDSTALAFTAAVALLTGVVVGLAPAFRFCRRDQIEVLREMAASSGGRLFGRSRISGLMVVAEISMAMMLLVGGGLMIRSFVKLSRVEAGYDTSNVITFEVALPANRYPVARVVSYAEDFVARLRSVPGVQSAAYAHQLPMVQLRQGRDFRRAPIMSSSAFNRALEDFRLVSRDYLKTMNVHLLAGRLFDERDARGRPQVVVVNKALVAADFPDEDPIGQLVYVGTSTEPWQIVGIVDNMRQFGLDADPEPQFFVDFRQWPAESPIFDIPQYFALRIARDPAAIVSETRRIAREVDPQATIASVENMDAIVAATIARPKMYAVLTGIFAAVAVLLAAIGIYGVMAYSVVQRTREIGVRMALGARRLDVLAFVLGQSVLLTLTGIAAGLAGALALTRYIRTLLFGITPFDPETLIAVTACFAAVAFVAALVPARRATRVDPLIALRSE